jgi:hypothetical protein
VAIAGISYYALTQEEPIFFKGRLTIARINPNLLAQSASVFALLCVFHVLLRDTSRWMTIAMSCTGDACSDRAQREPRCRSDADCRD